MEGLYSKMVKGGERTYFVDVRKARTRAKYIAITEVKPSSDGMRRFNRTKVVVHEEHLEEVRCAINEACVMAGLHDTGQTIRTLAVAVREAFSHSIARSETRSRWTQRDQVVHELLASAVELVAKEGYR